MRRRYVAFIAVAAIAVAAWMLWGRYAFELYSAERRLNGIYERERPFEFRWAGAPHAPVKKRTRESTSAARSIRSELDGFRAAMASRPKWIWIAGRAAMMAGDYDGAVRAYKRAMALNPSESVRPEIEIELACAYALRGASEDRSADLGPALDHAGKALLSRKPSAAVHFDAGLILHRAWLLKMTVEEMDASAKSEKDEAWRAEAANEADRVRRFIGEREALMKKVEDPATVDAAALEKPGALELAQQYAIERWIVMEPRPVNALRLLANTFEQVHHDLWWRDFLRTPRSEDGDQALANAYTAYALGHYSEMGGYAEQAEKAYAKAGNAAGRMKAWQARIQMSTRGDRVENCHTVIGDFKRENSARGYRWLAILAAMDGLSCREVTRQGDIFADLEIAADQASEAGFAGLELYARTGLTNKLQSLSTPLRGWTRLKAGLAFYWQSAIPSYRLHSLCNNLRELEGAAGRTHSALWSTRESVASLAGQRDQAVASAVLGTLSFAEAAVGLYTRSEDDWRLSEATDARGGSGQTAKNHYQREMQRARSELAANDVKAATQRLQALSTRGGSAVPMIEFDRAELELLLGTALLRSGENAQAGRHFEEVMRIDRTMMSTSRAPAERESRTRAYEGAFEGLTEARLRMGSPPGQALAAWLSFRAGHAADRFATLQANPQVTLLVFAPLPGGVSVWLRDLGGVRQRWVSRVEAEAAVSTLAEMASDRDAPNEARRKAARKAEDVLLGDFSDRLGATGQVHLRIDASGFLVRVPWAALENKKGVALIERYAIVLNSPGQELGNEAGVHSVRLERIGIFADPDPGPRLDDFPRLPDAVEEGRRVAAQARTASLYYGGDASEEAFRKTAPAVNVLHYAGHGVSFGGFGGLMLSGKQGFLTSEQIAGLNLSGVDLVVLAACSSGANADAVDSNADLLVRGFLDAGAARVVAAKWDIDSAVSREIMTRFYSDLSRGTAASDALRHAVLAVKATSNSFGWAGFEIYGRL